MKFHAHDLQIQRMVLFLRLFSCWMGRRLGLYAEVVAEVDHGVGLMTCAMN
jgi:hypothetical protein